MEEEKEKKLNVSISDGKAFYAHEISLNYNPAQFMLDFKCITPRIDLRNRQSNSTNIVIEHNLVMIDPFQAKRVFAMLGDMIKAYEKEYGEIKKPKTIEKYEQKQGKQKSAKAKTEKAEKTAHSPIPSYLG